MNTLTERESRTCPPAAGENGGLPKSPSAIPRLPLARARKLADQIVDRISPFCDRIEIAGSIRRQRPTVGDIDLVIHGNWLRVMDLVRRGCRIVTAGEQNVIAEWPLTDGTPWQLDIFFARRPGADLFAPVPGNFGTLFLCRTGSKEFNIWFANQCRARGLMFSPYRGILGKHDEVVAAETEEELFHAAGLDFIRPEDRER